MIARPTAAAVASARTACASRACFMIRQPTWCCARAVATSAAVHVRLCAAGTKGAGRAPARRPRNPAPAASACVAGRAWLPRASVNALGASARPARSACRSPSAPIAATDSVPHVVRLRCATAAASVRVRRAVTDLPTECQLAAHAGIVTVRAALPGRCSGVTVVIGRAAPSARRSAPAPHVSKSPAISHPAPVARARRAGKSSVRVALAWGQWRCLRARTSSATGAPP